VKARLSRWRRLALALLAIVAVWFVLTIAVHGGTTSCVGLDCPRPPGGVGAGAGHPATAQPSPGTSADAGISFSPLSAPSASGAAQAQAVEVARFNIGSMANGPNVKVSVQYGELTDSDYTMTGPSGEESLRYINRLVWLVTFAGAHVPNLGPSGNGPDNGQMNVAVDANTGEYLEAYSYR